MNINIHPRIEDESLRELTIKALPQVKRGIYQTVHRQFVGDVGAKRKKCAHCSRLLEPCELAICWAQRVDKEYGMTFRSYPRTHWYHINCWRKSMEWIIAENAKLAESRLD